MILNNAELRKNIWLDFSPHRVFLTPIIIGLIVYLCYLASSAGVAATMAYALAFFFIYLWGTKNASETVIEEVNQNTWDFQRQSPITPLEMSIGKLLGSTLFAWYGGLICLMIYVVLSFQTSSPNTSFSTPDIILFRDPNMSPRIFILICGGLLTQTFALLLSLQIIPSSRHNKNIKSFRYFLLALIMGWQFSKSISTVANLNISHINWYTLQLDNLFFALCSLTIFLFWGLIGLYRSFAKELQYPNIPWAWFVFNIFCLVYFSGLTTLKGFDLRSLDNLDKIKDLKSIYMSVPTYFAFFIALILTYIASIIDNLNILQYKKLWAGLKESRPIEALTCLPMWVISFAFVLIMGFICLTKPLPTSELMPSFSSGILVLTTCLFAFRDICLLHYFNFKQSSRVLSTFALYLFILYIIIPGVFSLIQVQLALPAFVPSYGQNTALALSSLSIQILVLMWLIKSKFKPDNR